MLTVLIQGRLRFLMEPLGYDSLEGMLADLMEVVDSRIKKFQA